jgi:hypothetical protein
MSCYLVYIFLIIDHFQAPPGVLGVAYAKSLAAIVIIVVVCGACAVVSGEQRVSQNQKKNE